MSDLLTPKQAADRLKVHVRTIRRLCHRGELAGAFQVGRQWRIPVSAIEAVKVPAEPPHQLDERPVEERYGRGYAVAE
ncbi:MAG: helix-turn-helix domain-containing protein [Bacteroidota bacterium]